MDSNGGESTSDPMEIDFALRRLSAEVIHGTSGKGKMHGKTNGDASAERTLGDYLAGKTNGDSSAGNSTGDASATKTPVSPLLTAFVAGDTDAYKDAYRAAIEAEKAEGAAQGGEFKVPRFSSRNPPPPTVPEASSRFKVPRSPPEVFPRPRLGRMDPPIRPRPKTKEIVWPPPLSVSPELSGTQESLAEPEYTENLEAFDEGRRKGVAEKKRQVVEEKVLAENAENIGKADLATVSEGEVGPAESEAVLTEVSNASEGQSAGTDSGNSGRQHGRENSLSVDSTVCSEDAARLTAEEPRADVGTPLDEKSAAAGPERLIVNSGATDLASASTRAVAPAPGEPGTEGDTSSQRKLDAVDHVTGVPPYVKPSWSAAPGHSFKMEVLKEGVSLGTEDVSQKGAYMFGRSDRCDFVLEHPTVSRFHAVLQYNASGKAFMFDLGSTHGTFINKRQVQGKIYFPMNVGDIVRFGHSSRLYHFQGPTEFMPEEGLSKSERHAVRMLELAQGTAEREQSLVRARRNAVAADGATWGMQEDAVEEEEEEDAEEITWQNFKGELTEKQQKTLEKVHKRQEKLANLKKENDAIQAKEISQGGLTQGQQTQTARNEQRMAQLVEELENMEKTLNESIREAIAGRSGLRRGGQKSSLQNEDEDENLSDDEFYDRTTKLKEKRKNKDACQVVETAETLLEKKSSLSKEIESVRLLMEAEEKEENQKEMVKMEAESVDPLDKFMTSISTSIEQDRMARLQKELDRLTRELDRVERLLKIADPTRDALRKWELKQTPESLTATADLAYKIDKRIFPRKEDAQELESSPSDAASKSAPQPPETSEDGEKTLDLRPLDPPIRLGAPVIKEESEEKLAEPYGRESESAAGFVHYKDRKKDIDEGRKERSASKAVESGITERREEEGNGVDKDVASSVALLLRHKRGLAESDTETQETTVTAPAPAQKSRKKKKKIYGPAKPSYMTNVEEEESWVPPTGQTGDGRTALNDKYGY